MRRIKFVRVVLCAMAFLAPVLVYAQETDINTKDDRKTGDDKGARVKRVEALYAEGAALFKDGNYQESLEKFKEAYAILPVANLLFNIARSHEAMGEIDEAISSYETFLAQDGASGEALREGRSRLKELKRVKSRAGTQSVEDGGVRGGSSGSRGARRGAFTPADDSEQTAQSGVNFKMWKWVALGAGVLIAAGGAVALSIGLADEATLKDDPGYNNTELLAEHTRQEALDLRDSGKSKKTLGVALLSVGGAALATSALFFVLDGRKKESAQSGSRNVAWGVSPTIGGGAMTMSGRF